MSEIYCVACSELREIDPNLIVNGIGDDECTSLQNDTGLSVSGGNDDCTDLTYLNDCLVGNLVSEVDNYDVCDWREFTKAALTNVWTVLKALICTICGLWTNIHRLWCYVNYLLSAEDVAARLDESDFVTGTGVSFDRDQEWAIRPSVVISGSTYRISGSIKVDLSVAYWSELGLSNLGASNGKINTPNGNYTLCIVKIDKTLLPEIESLESCTGQFVNAAMGDVFVQAKDEGSTYAGQWGYNESGSLTVPDGYMYLRVSLSSLLTWGIEYGDSDGYADVTFSATGLAKTNPSGIVC